MSASSINPILQLVTANPQEKAEIKNVCSVLKTTAAVTGVVSGALFLCFPSPISFFFFGPIAYTSYELVRTADNCSNTIDSPLLPGLSVELVNRTQGQFEAERKIIDLMREKAPIARLIAHSAHLNGRRN